MRDDREEGIKDIKKDIAYLHIHLNDSERYELVKELKNIYESNKQHYNEYAELKGLKRAD